MSALDFFKRPKVKFDVNNPDHRKWLGEFTVNLSWGNCPVTLVFDGYGNTIGQMQRQLIEYYISREFKKKPKIA